MSSLFTLLFVAFFSFFFFLIAEPLFRFFLRLLGVYGIVEEGTCHVYVLFGKVVGILDEPGLQLLWLKMGPKALFVRWLGKRHILDMRLDQK